MKQVWFLVVTWLLSAATHGSEHQDGNWYFQTSVLTRHFSPEPEHNNRQLLLGVERHYKSNWLWGLATFRNSFGQQTIYAYGARQFDADNSPLYAKLTAGVVHGYRGEHRDKIPLNHLRVAPALLPAVGANWQSVGIELIVFGTAGSMLTVGYRF